MITKQLFHLFFLSVILISCSKTESPSEQLTTIDVSKQWLVGSARQLILGLGDGQWQTKVFTTQEQNLFASLDTANLVGTSKPDSVLESPISYNCAYPNPFASENRLSFRFTNGFNGQIELKFVIVDSLLRTLDKGAMRVQATSYPQIPLNPSSSNELTIKPNIPIGTFRLYYTLSSQLNQHFYKSWGNIQRTL